MDLITVVKKGGQDEPFDLDKFHKVSAYACEGLKGVHPSSIEINAAKKLSGLTKTSTSDLTNILIKAAIELITEDTPNYQYVAGRLTNFNIRKQVYGSYTPPSLYDLIKKNVKEGWYIPEILDMYTEEEINYFDSKIDHSRDENYTIGAWKQLTGKYLVRDRKAPKGKGFKETPQFQYMLIPMILFAKRKDRKELIVSYYNETSRGSYSTISQSTPIQSGVRTPTKQFSSCVVGNIGDSLDSINAGSEMTVNYVSKRAGIGLNMAPIRPVDAPIRNGEVKHTGVLPFTKHIMSAVKSSSQGGVRGGAATVYYNIFHYEIEDILTYKNNRGTEENRARHLDYGININTHFYKKVVAGEDYWLFNTDQTPGLYEAFFKDPELFEELYDKFSRRSNIQKKKVNAKELFINLVIERMGTGRIYIHNVDNANKQTVYKDNDLVYSSNLCLEIELVTEILTRFSNLTTNEAIDFGLYHEGMEKDVFKDVFGEVGLCTLSNLNWGAIKKPEDFETPCKLVVYALDELLDYQDYPMIAAEIPAKSRRQLGVGVNNLAHFLAKHKVTYGSPEALELVDEYMQAMYYYLTKASLELAKEKGAAEWFKHLDYDFIFNRRAKEVDKLVPHKLRHDWDSLKEEIDEYGLRHTMLVATPPSESNSLVINATNGVEPVRSKIVTKGNGDDTYPQVVPNMSLKYDMLWDMKMSDYLKVMAILQKYHDQGISNTLSYDPDAYPDGKLPLKVVLMDLLFAAKNGLKGIYYHNTKGEDTSDDCESCKI